MTIRVGRDAANTTNFRATQYTLPVCADIMLLRINQPVSRSQAIPIPVLANFGDSDGTADSVKLAGERFKLASWGYINSNNTSPSRRQQATARYDDHDGQKLTVNIDAPAGMLKNSGDSGSPLLWTSPSGVRYVIGILQGPNNFSVGRYTPTFRGPLDNGAPAVSAFFNKAAPQALECPRAQRKETLTLGSWWSRGREDNKLIAKPSFAGCHSAVRSPDYAYYRTEGYLFNPTLPQPDGTVPLYRWYRPDLGDNYTNTRFPQEGEDGEQIGSYRFSGLEGYLYDPAKTQPPYTRPLYTWYSPTRGDYWTTTQHASQGAAGADLSPDYRFNRLEGYVPVR